MTAPSMKTAGLTVFLAAVLLTSAPLLGQFAQREPDFDRMRQQQTDTDKTWKAADPTPACKVDGLYGEYGVTWAHHYPGYSTVDLLTLPRVTTETGCTIGGLQNLLEPRLSGIIRLH